tara:strand:+ start:2366 stop:2620 length:255 start_codon:yes stop_codon:yes gene_type:complete
MSEHFLYRPEVGTPFNQMCGKRMPEGMWANGLFQSDLGCQVFDDHKYHHPGKTAATFVEKQEIFLAPFNRDVHPDLVPVDFDVF